MIKKNKVLRGDYIGKVIKGSNNRFLGRMLWNFFCIGGVVIGLGYWMIK